jgi:hypothetical protein
MDSSSGITDQRSYTPLNGHVDVFVTVEKLEGSMLKFRLHCFKRSVD